MILNDESSIVDMPEIAEPPKMFSNPFFRNNSNPLKVKMPINEVPPIYFSRKPISKPSIWESEREDSMKITPVNLNTNSTIRNQANFTKPSVAFSNGSERGVVHYMSTLPTDKVLQYFSCRGCGMPFEVGFQLDDHQRTCLGVDSKLESIPPTEIDKIISHYDSVIEGLYLTLHLYAANYLSRFSVGTCAVAEDALKNIIDCVSSNKTNELSKCVENLQNSIKSIASSPTSQSPADRSTVVLIESAIRTVKEKVDVLDSCPYKIKLLLEKIKEVDLVTNSKLEELKLWKSKCSTFSSSSFKPSVSFF